jgi:phosphoribosylformylglycinamidine synthase subunit PurSL
VSHWRFEICNRPGFPDLAGEGVLQGIKELGIDSVECVQSLRIFLVDGDLDDEFAKRVAEELLTDRVCEQYQIGRVPVRKGKKATLIEVHLKSGVTDPVAQSVTTAIADMGRKVESVRTARKYFLVGKVTDSERDNIIRKVLANDCIEQVVTDAKAEPPSPHTEPYKLNLKHIEITKLDDAGLVRVSKGMDLFLNLVEMKAIQKHYQGLKREPTDIELESLAQTWSEHCVHKTLKSSVDMEVDGKHVRFENLVKDTVFKATQDLKKPWCISVFADNAGVIEFDEKDAVCFKVETHNHPSALDPYGGAATGIGGVIRDPMGTGMGSKPIANTDIFCFASPDKKMSDVPKGVLHPKRIMKGVVSGVRDYGNRMGIPTVNGAIYFDDRYMANPLVFCGNIGIMPKDKCFKHAHVGDLVMVVGGRTGRDGIHGATFSSGEMTHEHEEIFSHAVQIGNAIVEKKMLDTLLQARDAGLYESVTDCGAGGLSSAVGEMGEKFGAEVDLDKVPLKYAGLNYTETWISEAQERMVIAVKPENLAAISKVFADEDVEATVIGRFTGDEQLTLRYRGQVVGQVAMDFLHNGVPKYSRKAVWKTPKLTEPKLAEKKDYTNDLLAILSSWNVASKEWVIRQYDHEVQGASVVKPLTGVTNDGPSDAAVIRPKFDSNRGVAISCGMNPCYGDIDPYWMAMAGIDEAIRNIICVGADPERIAILDNFCWGDCTRPETFGSLVRAAQACYDGAMAFGTPFVSGKDSLNNEFKCEDGTRIAIPSTLLISAMGIVENVEKCVTMDAKKAGNVVFVVGKTSDELGGSHYYKLHGELGANVPKTDAKAAAATAKKLHQAMVKGLVAACHDCSEGGLAVALAEMAFAGGLGISAELAGAVRSDDCVRSDSQLFSESNSRYVVEVKTDKAKEFAAAMAGAVVGQIGVVTAEKMLRVKDAAGRQVIACDLDTLKAAWQKPLSW